MIDGILVLQLLIFGFSLWLGLYLLARDSTKAGLRFAGLGLVSYALGLAVVILLPLIPDVDLTANPHWRSIPLLLPSLFWMAAVQYLLPESSILTFNRNPITAIASITLLVIGLGAMAFSADLTRALAGLVPVVFLVGALIKIRQAFRTILPRRLLVILLTATIFFLLGVGLMMIPVSWLSSEIVLMAVSFDLILLGISLGYLDAYEEGTRLLPDALRSLAAAGLVSVLFGGQIIAIMILNPSFWLTVLLFTIVGTAITLETFSGVLQTLLDRFIFMDEVPIQRERQQLRAINNALPRSRARPDLLQMDEADFARLTRRALSHFNDLEKLAASPLTHLPIITLRLAEQGKPESTIERTHALKALLTECILKLKPYSDSDFETADAWRYYNVLYFPYVLGIKPYSTGATEDLDATSTAALDWFQTQVPERTLYNWQTTAARLVARTVREMHLSRASSTESG